MKYKFEKAIISSIELKNNLRFLNKEIEIVIKKIYKCLKDQKKILICGNGGSAEGSIPFSRSKFLVIIA